MPKRLASESIRTELISFLFPLIFEKEVLPEIQSRPIERYGVLLSKNMRV